MAFMEIDFWEHSRGSSPIADFLDELDPKPKTKILKWMELLEEHGLSLTGGILEKVTNKPVNLWEFKVTHAGLRYRGLFTVIGATCWFVHIFVKKDGQIPKSDIDLAMARSLTLHQKMN
jgi:phage-related protein